MSHKIKIYRNLTIPKSLNDELIDKVKGKTLMNCYYILWSILSDNRKGFKNIETFKPIPSTRFVKMLGEKYHLPLYTLLDNGLIERTEEFRTGKCFDYRLSSRFFEEEDTVKIKFTYYAKLNAIEYSDMKEERESFLEFFNELEIPFVRLYNKVEEKLSNLSIEDYTTGTDVLFPFYKCKVELVSDDWIGVNKKMTKVEALALANNLNKILVQDGYRFLIINSDYYLATKKTYIKLAWTSSIDNLKDEKSLYAKRNNKNTRLDTNFTNMSSDLFNIICDYNNLEQLDIQNSQPALLSHVLEAEGITGEDVDLYHKLTRGGEFYEFIAKEFGKSRQEAKMMTFEILFSEGFKTSMARRFAKTFPTIAKYIIRYKRENGYKSFSVMLQRLEANIFIDNIYYSVRDEGYNTCTKHDSIIFKSKDYEFISNRVRVIFRAMNFRASIKDEKLGKAI